MERPERRVRVWTAFLREVDRASLSAMHDDTDGEDGRRMRDRAFENY